MDPKTANETPDPPIRRAPPAIWTPLIILAAATVLILVFDLDRRLQGHLHTPEQGWFLSDHWFVDLLYDHGCRPAHLIGAAALLALIVSLALRRYRHWWKPATFLLLVMGLGPGLLVNGVFKKNFGRPRPRQIAEFGGEMQFHPLLRKGVAGQGKSFPSGHASMGFYLLSPYFLLLARRRRLAYLVLAGGLAYGVLMGLVRMAAGGHFPGDILWSGAMVYFACWLWYLLLRVGPVRAGPKTA